MAAKDNLSEQLHLFTPPDPEPAVDVSDWARQQQWHASKQGIFPKTDRDVSSPKRDDSAEWRSAAGHPLGFHMGTPWAATDRDVFAHKVYHPLNLQGEDYAPTDELDMAVNEDYGFDIPHLWSDDSANGANAESTRAVRQGKNIPYLNEGEDVGSVSYRAPRKNIRTWSQSVIHNPDSTFAERAAVRKGAELAYVRLPNNIRGPVNTIKDSQGESMEVPTPRGLKASPIDFSPEGLSSQAQHEFYDEETGEMILPERRLLGRFTYPEKTAREERIRQSKLGTNRIGQLPLELEL